LRLTREELTQRAQSYTSNVSHTQPLGETLPGKAWMGVWRDGLKLKKVFKSWEVATNERGGKGKGV
jgi:hypothetical protein